MHDILKKLKSQFNDHFSFQLKREGIFQIIAPLFHEDGDLIEIYLEWKSKKDGVIRICDYGKTLMRLSYAYELDTPHKEKVFQQILTENNLSESNGNIYFESKVESLYPAILHYSQTVGKITNMQLFRREVIRSMFYEMFNEFVESELTSFNPQKSFYPIESRDEYEVDYKLDVNAKPYYLFAVKDSAKARLVTISCQAFQLERIPHRSVAVHEDFNGLNHKDRNRITNVVGKQYSDFNSFQDDGIDFFTRER